MKKLHPITFTVSLVFLIGTTLVTAQNIKGKINDPFTRENIDNAELELGIEINDDDAELSIGILLEYFKLDHITANSLVSKYSKRASDAQDLRDELQALIKDGKAELHETAWINARSGYRAQTKSAREFIYPTAYDPPKITKAVGDASTPPSKESKTKQGSKVTESKSSSSTSSGGGNPVIHMTSFTPTGFRLRNVGLTLEVDPALGADRRTIDLNLASELVMLLEDQQMARKGFEHTAKGLEHVWMPTFYTIRSTTQITMIDGKYWLFGIHSLPDDPKTKLISMIRADVIVVK